MRTARIAAPTAAAEKVIENTAAPSATAENFAENLKRIVETATTAARAAESARAIKRGVPILIVSSAFLRIGQRFVGFADLLEVFLGLFCRRDFCRDDI